MATSASDTTKTVTAQEIFSVAIAANGTYSISHVTVTVGGVTVLNAAVPAPTPTSSSAAATSKVVQVAMNYAVPAALQPASGTNLAASASIPTILNSLFLGLPGLESLLTTTKAPTATSLLTTTATMATTIPQAAATTVVATSAIKTAAVVLAPAPISLGSGSDTVALFLTETAYRGDAQFEILVNGVPVGGILTTSVLKGSGMEQEIDLHGNFSTTGQQVTVRMLNATSGGTASTQRALYVDKVTYDGVNEGVAASLLTDTDASLFVGSPKAVTLGSGPDVIHIQASEFGFAAGAKLAVSVDGVQLVQPVTVSANTASGALQDIYVNGLFKAGTHTVSLSLANPVAASGGTAAPILTVASVTVDGVAQAALTGTLTTSTAKTATASFLGAQVTTAATTAVAGASGSLGLVAVAAPTLANGTPVLTVGVGKEYSTIAAAVAASQNGSVILVDAGTYTNDFVTTYSKITLEAVGGRVSMVATEPPPNLKGLITEENDLTVVGFDFSGVAIDAGSGGNGAGIRVDGGNLVLENDSFTGNQNGLLVNPGTNSITIDHSLFNDNGSGTGFTHNVYIGAVASATITNSIFENAQVGHELKSRAAINNISNNEFIDGVGIGDGSYDIDLPNGGQDTLTNNTIIKGPNSPNYAMVHFGGEGIPYAGSSLTATDNVFEADNNANAIPLLNQTSIPAVLTGNTFTNIAGALSNGPATITNSVDGNGKALADQTTAVTVPSGAIVYTDTLAHFMTLGSQTSAVQGGAGYLTVLDVQGHVLIVGGTGGMDVEEGANAGGSTIDTAIGSTNVLDLIGSGMDTIDSEGKDTINPGSSNQTGVVDGTATIKAGSGNNSWTINGTASLVTGTGSNFVSVGSSGSLAVSGVGTYYEIQDNGGAVSWNTTGVGNVLSGHGTGGFSLQNYGGGANVTTAGGAGAVMSFDTGNVNLFSGGPDVLYAGSGNDTFIVNDGATIYAGTGALSVFARGGGGGANVFGASGDTTIDGDSGGITYTGTDVANTVEVKLSGITLIGGAGRMTVNNYAFNETVVGGLGGITMNNLGGSGGTVTTVANSTNVLTVDNNTVHSYGSDTISITNGAGSYDVHGTATATVAGGTYSGDLSGTDVVTLLGGYQGVTAEAGANVTLNTSTVAATSIQVKAKASMQENLIGATAGSATIASFSVSGGAVVSALASASGLSLQTDGSGAETVTLSGAVTLQSAGADVVHAGTGAEVVTLSGSGAQLWGGAGTLAVQDNNSTSNNFVLTGGVGAISVSESSTSSMRFIGSSGAATLTGGTMNIAGGAGSITATGRVSAFTGGSGAATLTLDTQGSQITFGTGTTKVTEAGSGVANLFNFVNGASGTDVIAGFRVGTDKAVLGAGVKVSSQSASSSGTLFTLSNGAHVTFAGVTSASGIFG